MAVMIDREQRERAQKERILRAAQQREQYEFVWDAASALWLCRKLGGKGEPYRVDEHRCSCGDWQWRCSFANLKCKHQISLGLFKLLNNIPSRREETDR